MTITQQADTENTRGQKTEHAVDVKQYFKQYYKDVVKPSRAARRLEKAKTILINDIHTKTDQLSTTEIKKLIEHLQNKITVE